MIKRKEYPGFIYRKKIGLKFEQNQKKINICMFTNTQKKLIM